MTTTEILTGIKDWSLSKLRLKQDVINDLAAIRSGSQAGSTAVQPSDLSSYFNNASYDTNTHRINFYHGQNVVAYVDASPFIVDGMVNDVRIENGYLVIDFNTDSGKQDISIPLTDIFDPSNYYDREQIDEMLDVASKTPIRVQTGALVAIEPNVLNLWQSPVASLTITLQSGTSGYVSEYMIQFTCPQNTATTLTLPNTVRWANNDELESEAGYTYQVSVVDNLAVYAGWEAQSNA